MKEDHAIPYRAEVWRKAIHLVALVVPLGMALLGKTISLYLLVPAALLAITGDVLRVRSEGFAIFIQRLFGFMMREEEQRPVGGAITLNGATWVLLSAALLTFIFPIRIAVPAFVMFMLSDAAAALVGRRYGRRHWGQSSRTLEGTAAFFVMGFITMTLFATFTDMVLWVGVASVFAAALAEVPSRPFNDNLRVPLVAATLIFLLERFVLQMNGVLFLG